MLARGGLLTMFQKLSKYFGALDIFGFLIIIYLSVVSIYGFDTSYDTLAYHLPFAGLRSGLIPPDQFILPVGLDERYRGFPAFIDLVQGWLWKLSGRPEAAQLISTISIFSLGLYVRITYKIQIFWIVLIYLSIPTLHEAINSSYTDLWTNSFFTLHLISAVRSGRGKNHTMVHAAISSASLAIAVNSKEQFYIIGSMSYSIILFEKLYRLAAIENTNILSIAKFREILVFLAFFPVIFFGPIRNALIFGNPIYPIGLTIFGHKLNGPELNSGWWGPDSLAHAPQPVRYLLSQLDLEATNMRPDGYTLGQGDQPGPAGQAGDRMGGSLAVLLMSAITCLIVGFKRAGVRVSPLQIAGFLALTTLVAFFPGSNELRYFSFIEIAITVGALYFLQIGGNDGDVASKTLLAAFKCLLIYSAVYVSALNGFHHFKWPHHAEVKDTIAEFHARDQLRGLLGTSKTICYARVDQLPILYSPVLNAKKLKIDYRFIVTRGPSECPAGAAIIQ